MPSSHPDAKPICFYMHFQTEIHIPIPHVCCCGVGIAGMLVYGVVVLNAQFVDSIRLVWREVQTSHFDVLQFCNRYLIIVIFGDSHYGPSWLGPTSMKHWFAASHVHLKKHLRAVCLAGCGEFDPRCHHSRPGHCSVWTFHHTQPGW